MASTVQPWAAQYYARTCFWRSKGRYLVVSKNAGISDGLVGDTDVFAVQPGVKPGKIVLTAPTDCMVSGESTYSFASAQ